jgi:hypothetical protein
MFYAVFCKQDTHRQLMVRMSALTWMNVQSRPIIAIQWYYFCEQLRQRSLLSFGIELQMGMGTQSLTFSCSAGHMYKYKGLVCVQLQCRLLLRP